MVRPTWRLCPGSPAILANFVYWTLSWGCGPEFCDRVYRIDDQGRILQTTTTSAFNYPCITLARCLRRESRIRQVSSRYGINRPYRPGSRINHPSRPTARQYPRRQTNSRFTTNTTTFSSPEFACSSRDSYVLYPYNL